MSAASTSTAAASAPIDDPSFARFANLEGLLDLAIRAENRLRGHLDPKRIERFDILHTQAVVLSICRLTAVRKTLLEAWKSARAPFSAPPVQKSAPANDNPVEPAPPAATPIPASPDPNATAQHARINSIRSIPVCPVIPNSKNPNADLAKMMTELKIIEKGAKELAQSVPPDSRRAVERLFPKMPMLPKLPRLPAFPKKTQRAQLNLENSSPGAEQAPPDFDQAAPQISRALAAALINAQNAAPPSPAPPNHPPPEP